MARMSEPSPNSDSQQTRLTLLAKIRNSNDQAAWREFTDIYRPLLLAYISSRGLQADDAQDVVQEILVKLVRKLQAFDLDHDRGRFRTWLYEVTRNAVIDWTRRQQRIARPTEEPEHYLRQVEQAANADSLAEFALEHRRRVLDFAMEKVRQNLLDGGKEGKWKCFQQTTLDQRKAAEVATELDIQVASVYVNTSRVLKMIREECAVLMESLDDDNILSR